MAQRVAHGDEGLARSEPLLVVLSGPGVGAQGPHKRDHVGGEQLVAVVHNPCALMGVLLVVKAGGVARPGLHHHLPAAADQLRHVRGDQRHATFAWISFFGDGNVHEMTPIEGDAGRGETERPDRGLLSSVLHQGQSGEPTRAASGFT